MKTKFILHLLSRTFLVAFLCWLPLSAQIISQYVETNSGTAPKGIEIYNNTGATLDFSVNNLIISQGTNGGALAAIVTVNTGSLAPGAVMVIGTADLITFVNTNYPGVLTQAYTFTFNGDDALQLTYNSVVTDVFGTPGTDPGTSWPSPSGGSPSTANQNIELASGIATGDTDGWADPATRFVTVDAPAGSSPLVVLTGFGVAPGSAPACSITALSTSAATCNGSDVTFDVTFTPSPATGAWDVINTADNAILGTGTASPVTATYTGPTSATTINIIVGSQATPTCVSNAIAVSIPACPAATCTLVLGSPVIACNASTAGTSDAVTVSIPFSGGPETGVTVSGSGTIGGDDPALVASGNITVTAAESSSWNISISGGDCATPVTASGSIAATQCPAAVSCASGIINEFHYDNTGTDTGEFVEIFIPNPQPADLSNYSIYLMNGAVSYGTIALNNASIVVSSDGTGSYYVWNVVLQNGAADGIALTCSGTLLSFLSYEGQITGATIGSLTGQTSTDTGVAQSGTEPIGSSLQLIGGVWVSTTAHTKGFTNENLVCSIASLSYGTPGACNDNGTPADATDDYYPVDITVSYSNPPATGTLSLTGAGLHSSNTAATTSFAGPYGTSHTFTGVRLLANNAATSVTASFSATPLCTITNAAGPAVAPCSTPPACNAHIGVFPHQ